MLSLSNRLTVAATALAALTVFTPTTISAVQASEPIFAHDESRRAGKSYSDWLEANYRVDQRSAAFHLRAGQRILDAGGNPNAAARHFASAAKKAPKTGAAWLGLARALLATPPNRLPANQRFSTPRNASGVAHIALDLAKTSEEQAAALAVLGEALKRRSYWRPAIDALRTSLSLKEDRAVRETFAALRAQHGFRIVNYDVETERVSPRLCVRFSERLRTKTTAAGSATASNRTAFDYTTFVSVDGKDPDALTIENARLCISGLVHGESYRVRLRSGLPAAINDELAKTVDLAIFVRDRAPTVRFNAGRYILPKTGQVGIPLTTINTDAVAIKIFRIGDRALISKLMDGTVGRDLDRWSTEAFKRDIGEEIYAGILPTRRQLNKEVITAAPVQSVVPEMKPGVYALHAEPKGAGERSQSAATQWFVVTDIGLTSVTGSDGIHIFARSLATAKPIHGARLRLLARNNEVLGTAIANANGYAQFAAPLTRGEGALQPAVIVAEHADGGYAFLKLDQAAFDLTDRGVKGRVAPGPIDGFLYTDRGVYRAGETVHVTGLVRTRQGTASRVPTTLIVARPDGVTHKTIALKDQADGGRTMALNLPKGAMRGTWRLRLHVDPKKPAIADAAVLVEDFLPERLALELELAKDKPLAMTGTSRIGIAGRYLYGPPAANLAIEGSVVVRAAKSDPAHPGFVFGDAEQLVTPVRGGLPIEQRTNADGRADLNFKLPPVPRTGRPLEAQVLVRLREPGGRTIERRTVRPVSADIARIGVKPAFKDATVREDTDASFTLVFLDRAGAPKPAANLTWQLVRLERHWQWYKRGASWSYDAVVIPRQVANGDVTTGTDGAARIKVPTEWGRYRLEVTSPDQDADQLRTTMLFTSGWNQSDDADSPEVLDVAADRKSYRPGETAKIRVSSQMAGRATVAILSDRLITTKTVELGAGDSEIAVPVEDTWGAGAYAAVILHRPMDIAEKRMPSRALGLTWIATDISAKSLTVALNPVAKMKSGQALSVPVSVSGLGADERAHVTVAAVDVGILNVTRFRAPSATGRFLKQLQLGAEIRDVYAKLIDGMSGERATFRSGGDADASLSLQAAPPMWKTVALFSGIVTTDADGRANVSFDIPEFAGTVRLMAVAWTKTKIGEASTDVTVRDPFALTVTTPRFLALGDTAELTFDIHNIEAPAGDYKIALSAVTDDGPVRLLNGQTATFARGERKILAVPFKAHRLGTAQIIAQVRGEAAPGSTPIAIKRELTFEVVAPGGDVKRTTTRTLQPGKQLVIDQGAVDGLIADGASLAVSVGPAAALDVPGLLASLDRYPYGCTEQTISRALPLLYANALGSTAGLEADANIAPRIRDAITRILGRQDSAGGFGIWSPSSPDLWLSAYTTDFLTRAREEGYAVPARAIKSAIQRLANFVAYTQNVQGDGASLAYALYALARNGRVPAGELRYYAETKLAAFKSPTAKAQLAAALTMIGDRQRARQVFDGAVASLKAQGPTGDQLTGRRDFGSRLRDVASVAALAAEAGFSGLSQRLMRELEGRLAARSLTSTQEQAWTLMAARALQATGADQTLTVNGRAHTGPLAVTYAARAIGNQSTTITNTSTTPTVVSMTAIGPSLGNEPAASNGFEIERRYYTLDGQPVTLGTAGDAAAIAQNQKLVVVLTVRSAKKGGRVLLVDRLPAGLEIENPALVASGAIKALGWIKSDLQPVHTEFRDDRFVAAYNLFGGRTVEGGGHVFHAAYIVRAVSKGTFAHPAATVEDMYRPERNARTASGRLTIAGRS